MKKISIIIPAYNSAKTLMACYESILNQTYQNFEVITVNDASGDNTLEIMNDMSKKDKRFISVDMPHGGVSRARNTGLKKATGYYLQFVDADDTLNPLMLEKMIKLIEDNDADLAICRFDHPFFKTYIQDEVFDLTNKDELISFYQETFGLVMPWNKVWKRDKFTVPFDEEVHFSEDELGNLANLPNIKKAVTTSEYLYNYYFPEKNSSAVLNSCIGRLVTAVGQGKSHTSLYWLGSQLLSKRKEIIKNGIEEKKLSINKIEDMCYYRLIDYSFFTLSAYFSMDIPQISIVKDFINVFNDKNFIDGFKAQEKYGFRLKKMSHVEQLILTERFIRLCYTAFKQKNEDKNFHIFSVYISLFLSLFAEKCGKLNPINFNAKYMLNLKKNSSVEAIYTKGILNDDIVYDNYNPIFNLNYFMQFNICIS